MNVDEMIEDDMDNMPMGAYAVLKGIYVGKCRTRKELVYFDDGDWDNIDEGLNHCLSIGFISKNLDGYELTEYGKKLVAKISEEYGWDE